MTKFLFLFLLMTIFPLSHCKQDSKITKSKATRATNKAGLLVSTDVEKTNAVQSDSTENLQEEISTNLSRTKTNTNTNTNTNSSTSTFSVTSTSEGSSTQTAVNLSAAMIPLAYLENGKMISPYLNRSLIGSAIDTSQTANTHVLFDTGSNTLILPRKIVNTANVKVLQKDMLSFFGDLSDLVSGEIGLQGQDGTRYMIPDFVFYVTPSSSCLTNPDFTVTTGTTTTTCISFHTAAGVFGAGPLLINVKNKQSIYQTTCVGSFLNFYHYQANHYKAQYGIYNFPVPGSTFTPNLFLGVGQQPGIVESNTKSFPMTPSAPLAMCDKIPSMQTPVSFYVPSTAQIQNPVIPVSVTFTQDSSTGTATDTSTTVSLDAVGILDTGGGAMTWCDGGNTTGIVAGAVTQSLQKLMNPTPTLLPLYSQHTCTWLNAGVKVSVMFKSKEGLDQLSYSYLSAYEGPRKITWQDVLSCVGSKTKIGPVVYVNLGTTLFNRIQSMVYDFESASVLITPLSKEYNL